MLTRGMDDVAKSTTSAGNARLSKLFAPRSVALIGVSADQHKLNGIPFWTLRRHGYSGTIYPVNPKYHEIDGTRCYARVGDIPDQVDVALIMVPAMQVPKTIAECGRKGVSGAVILSSGFEEVQEGKALVEQLRAAAIAHNVAVVGPNCEGIWSVRERMILTFGSAADRDQIRHGPIAVISQSGSIGGAIIRQLQDAGHGCAYFVSVGNETLIDAIDFLDWVIQQDDVRVVLLFIEGLREGHRMLETVAKARARGIRIVALKSGASAIGLAATASHTGKVAAPYRVYRDVFAQSGVIQVGSLVELIEAAEVLSCLSLPRRTTGQFPGVGVFSVPGGTRALTADSCEQYKVPLATFDEETVTQLGERLPVFGYPRNPTDITAAVLSDPALFTDCLELVAGDQNVEALIVQLANRGPRDARQWRPVLHKIAKRLSQPIILSFLADALPAQERCSFASDGLVCARDPVDAVKYMSWLYTARADVIASPSHDRPRIQRSLPHMDDWGAWAKRLSEIGIKTPPWHIIGPNDHSEDYCRGLRFPVVAKSLPSAADHKTELGLVRLGLKTQDEVAHAVKEIQRRLPAGQSVLVQEMVSGGVEAVLSVTHNLDFGPVLALGAGGVLVELFEDITFLALPVDEKQVERAVSRLKLHSLLQEFRGRSRADAAALCRAAAGLGELFLNAAPAISEIELNPIFILPEGQGVCAVDLMVH